MAEQTQLRIDTELASLIPDLDGETYGSLREDIKQHGVQGPIVITEDGTILDGHHRYRICQELGIDDYPVDVQRGLTEDEKLSTAIRLNAHRRVWTREERRKSVAYLHERGWSSRRIGQELDVSHQSVLRDIEALDLSGGPSGPPEPESESDVDNEEPEQKTVTGADGKTYPAKKTTTRSRTKATPPEYVCETCGEIHDRPIWHCDGCNTHYQMNQRRCPECDPAPEPDPNEEKPYELELLADARYTLAEARDFVGSDTSAGGSIEGLIRNLDRVVIDIRRWRGEQV